MPAALAIARQCVVSPGGSASVISTTRSIVAGDSGGLPEGRVASCSKPWPSGDRNGGNAEDPGLAVMPQRRNRGRTYGNLGYA
jgi:hypothetical protein